MTVEVAVVSKHVWASIKARNVDGTFDRNTTAQSVRNGVA